MQQWANRSPIQSSVYESQLPCADCSQAISHVREFAPVGVHLGEMDNRAYGTEIRESLEILVRESEMRAWLLGEQR